MRISNQRDLIQKFAESHPEIEIVKELLMTYFMRVKNSLPRKKDIAYILW